MNGSSRLIFVLGLAVAIDSSMAALFSGSAVAVLATSARFQTESGPDRDVVRRTLSDEGQGPVAARADHRAESSVFATQIKVSPRGRKGTVRQAPITPAKAPNNLTAPKKGSRPKMPSGNLVCATSKDTLTWRKQNRIVALRANTPGACYDGRRMLVYFCRESNVYVTISNNGLKWEEHQVQILGMPMDKIALDPDTEYLSDGKYRMYFYEHPFGTGIPLSLQGSFTINSAISEDGIHFRRENGERFAHERSMDPDVIQMGDVRRMFLSQDGKTLSAISSDNGRSFKFEKYIPQIGFITSTIEVPGGYRIYYNGTTGPENRREKPLRIRSAFSSDGAQWKVDPGVRIAEGAKGSIDEMGAGSMAALRTKDGTYWMFYVSEED